MMEKIGIFGGTFDPVHKGHIECIKYILNENIFDRVIIVPSSNPPHKIHNKISPVRHRIKMLELAFHNIPDVIISDIEKQGKSPNYTVLTMKTLKKQYTDSRIFFILGEDNLKTIHTWKDYKKLINENDFILMRRGGYALTLKDCPDLTSDEYKKLTERKINTPLINISSSEIRGKIHKKSKTVKEYLTKEVYEYIFSHNILK